MSRTRTAIRVAIFQRKASWLGVDWGKGQGERRLTLVEPRKRYRIFPKRRSVRHPVTGQVERISTGAFEQCKDALRPGERIRLYKLMRDLSLNEMVLAGGEGRELLAAIRKDDALERLRARQERERR
jgi:hypothetical protein